MNDELRIGLHSGQQYARVEEVVSLWQHAEELGYDWVSLFDHWRPEIGGPHGPCLDSAVTATAGLLGTRRVMGALMVAPAHAYDPGRLAMRVVALHQVSGGRFTLGLGAGGPDKAYRQFGLDRPGRKLRDARLAELAALLPRLVAGEQVSSTGQYRLDRAVVRPCVDGTAGDAAERGTGRHVPIAIGGGSAAVLEVAGRHADVWNTLACAPDRYAARLAAVHRAAREAGRDPGAIRPSVTFRAVIGSRKQVHARRTGLLAQQGSAAPDLAEYLSWGSAQECARALEPYVRAGARDLILAVRPPLDLATIEAFTAWVAPRLREVGVS